MNDPIAAFHSRIRAVKHWAAFEHYRLKQLLKGHHMDPLTALFNFASTPQGQVVVAEIIKLDKAIFGIFKDLIKKIHERNAPAPEIIAPKP